MDSGLYAACSALIARTQALDILANNLANVNTAGYKGESQFYQAFTAAAPAAQLGPLNSAVNQFGILAGQQLNLNAGAMEKTGNPLDIAVQGSGFLAVQSPTGIVYTRAGNLKLGPQGQLLTADGNAVLGGNQPRLRPIVLPSGTVSISPDGTISVDGALAGKVQLQEFAPGTHLTPLGDSYFSAPAGSAHAATSSRLLTDTLESSNVNPVQAETDLIALQRHFDLLERAMKIFNTDFDQTAATELPRVG